MPEQELKDGTKMFTPTAKKLIGLLMAATIISVLATGPAFGDEFSNDSSPSVTVSAGTGPRFDDTNGGGVFPTVANFQAVTLNGTPQLTAATIAPFTVVDDSGDEAGWNVTLTIPALQNGTGADCATAADHTIAVTGISMNPAVVRVATTDTVMTGVSSAGFTDFTAARKIVVATATHGMGSYTVSPQLLKLVVPSQTAIGTYCTQATIAITQGP
jgi:hypothetical protein